MSSSTTPVRAYAEGTEDFFTGYASAIPEDMLSLPAERQRTLYRGLSDVFPNPLPPDVRISEHRVTVRGQELRYRLYRPHTLRGSGLLCYFRGGGFVMGSLDSHHSVSAELAANTGLLTIAPDFRQAPEHPFPAAAEDSYTLLDTLMRRPELLGLDEPPSRLVLGGDSSGGNLSVCVSMMARDRGGPRIDGHAPISPVLDFARWHELNEDEDFGEEMYFYARSYCPDPALVRHPYISPLVDGDFGGLPPAYLVSAEYDDLQQDSVRYAERLRHHGVPVQLVIEPGLVHAPVRGRWLIPQMADSWRRYGEAMAAMAAD